MDDRNIIMFTGPRGAQFHDREVAKETFRFINGRNPNDKELRLIEEQFPVDNYPNGSYQISPDGLDYKGLFNKDMKSGFYIFKDVDGKYYEEQWKDTKRISRIEITEEQFNKFKSSLEGKR